ncbi:hypothetical protein Tco_1294214 [Tanacetum coccineum]
MKGGLKWSASAILFRGQILDKFWTLWITEFHKSVFRKRTRKIIREVFVKLLLKSSGKLSIRKTGIWSGRKADSSKRNIVFSPEMKLHYFDMNDMEFDDMENVVEEVEHGNFF